MHDRRLPSARRPLQQRRGGSPVCTSPSGLVTSTVPVGEELDVERCEKRSYLGGPGIPSERPRRLERGRGDKDVVVVPSRHDRRSRCIDGRLRCSNLDVGPSCSSGGGVEHHVIELTTLDRPPESFADPPDARWADRVARDRQRAERSAPEVIERRPPSDLDVVAERLEKDTGLVYAGRARWVDGHARLGVVIQQPDPPVRGVGRRPSLHRPVRLFRLR